MELARLFKEAEVDETLEEVEDNELDTELNRELTKLILLLIKAILDDKLEFNDLMSEPMELTQSNIL